MCPFYSVGVPIMWGPQVCEMVPLSRCALNLELCGNWHNRRDIWPWLDTTQIGPQLDFSTWDIDTRFLQIVSYLARYRITCIVAPVRTVYDPILEEIAPVVFSL